MDSDGFRVLIFVAAMCYTAWRIWLRFNNPEAHRAMVERERDRQRKVAKVGLSLLTGYLKK